MEPGMPSAIISHQALGGKKRSWLHYFGLRLPVMNEDETNDENDGYGLDEIWMKYG